jgi:hypothetical protein
MRLSDDDEVVVFCHCADCQGLTMWTHLDELSVHLELLGTPIELDIYRKEDLS